jgi:iron complex transport system permease protein
MPITFTAMLAGIGLALSGSLMQTVLRNPLAEPFTLGISAAAGFGAGLAIVFETSISSLFPWVGPDLAVAGNAFLFSLLAVGLVALFAARRGLKTETVTLLGIAIHFVFTALLAMAQYVASPDQLQGLVFWMLGSLLRASWLKLEINVAILLALLPLLVLNAWAMTALRAFGDGAVVMGVRVGRLRLLLLVAAALLAGGITATIGVVGFVGLVAPHVARMLVGEDQRFALPVTAACGLIVMTASSLASKLVVPGVVLPIGMVTSLLGLPFFVMLVLRRDGRAP